MPRQSNTLAKKPSSKRKKGEKEQSLVFNCTSCAQPQLLVQGKRNILCHPKLQVGVCRECLIFSHSDLVPKDDEGYEIYCQWCCELGNLICCDHCKAPYCEECISRNIGLDYYESLSECDEWKCFACDPTSIEDMRELTKAVLNHQNYNDPTDLLLEKCSAVFSGDANINDSDREEIVKERIRLRRTNLNETLKKKKQMSKTKNDSEEYEEEKEEESPDEESGSEEEKSTRKSSRKENKTSNGNSKKLKLRKRKQISKTKSESEEEEEEEEEVEEKVSLPEEKRKSDDEESLPSISLSEESVKKEHKHSSASEDDKSTSKNKSSSKTSNGNAMKLKLKRKPLKDSASGSNSDPELLIDEGKKKSSRITKKKQKVGSPSDSSESF